VEWAEPYTVERTRHDPVVSASSQTLDSDGRISAPHRVVDTLEIMEAAGTITQVMRAAGTAFRDDFHRAHLAPIKAAPMDRAGMGTMLRTPYGAGANTGAAERAGKRIQSQMALLGGIKSLAGSCAWAVLGEQQSLRQWAIERGVEARAASAVLRYVLVMLVDEKSLDRRAS